MKTEATLESTLPLAKEIAAQHGSIIIRIKDTTQVVNLNGLEMTIGRNADNDIVIANPTVSRVHAIIRKLQDGRLQLDSVGIQSNILTSVGLKQSVMIEDVSEVFLGDAELIIKAGAVKKIPVPDTFEMLLFPEEESLHFAEPTSITDHGGQTLLINTSHGLDATEPRITPTPQINVAHEDFQSHESFDEDHDEDEEDSDLPPAYSMKDLLKESRGSKFSGALISWEVIRYRGENMFEVVAIKSGHKKSFGKKGITSKIDKEGRCFIKCSDSVSIATDNELQNFQTATSKGMVRKWTEISSEVFSLTESDDICYLFRKVYSEKLVIEKDKQKADPLTYILGASSTWVHMIVIVLMSVFAQRHEAEQPAPKSEETEVFATLEIKDIIKPEPTPEPKVQTPMDKPVETARVEKPKKLKKVNKPVENFKVQTASKVKAAEIPDITQLGALGKIGGKGLFSKTASRSNMLVAAVSNVSAVRADGGAQTFSVSGNISALPGNEVRFARISTVSATGGTPQGDGFGSVTVGKRTGRKVQGLVVDASPPPVEVSVQGGLTRDEIAKVVQQHLSQIRYCYEKGLLDESSLAGKISMKWSIAATGDVSQAGIGSSTVRNASVHSCLSSEVESWKFPRPRNNGIVMVSFPFVFNSASF